MAKHRKESEDKFNMIELEINELTTKFSNAVVKADAFHAALEHAIVHRRQVQLIHINSIKKSYENEKPQDNLNRRYRESEIEYWNRRPKVTEDQIRYYEKQHEFYKQKA